MAKEIGYLNTDDVKVTSARLVIHGGTSYTMQHVTSVTCLKIAPDNTLAWQCIIWGCVLLMCTIGIIPLIIGIVMIANAKTRYALAVRTAGGEDQLLLSNDRDTIDEVVNAVNEAIVARS